MNQKISIILLLFFFVTFFSCKKKYEGPPSPIPEEKVFQELDFKEDTVALNLIKNLGFFSGSKIVDIGDYYMVDDDILFKKFDTTKTKSTSSNASYRLGNPSDPSESILQYNTFNLIDYTQQSFIPVKIDNAIPTSGPDNWRAELTSAVAAYNSVSNIQLQLVESTTANLINIKSDNGSLPDGTVAMAEWPTYGHPGLSILVNLDFHSDLSLSSNQKIYNLVHELGHCFGLRHSNWQSRGESESPNGAQLISNTSSSDPNSVMNGGTALNSWVGFSSGDIIALQKLYPKVNYAYPIVPIYKYYNYTTGNDFMQRFYSVPNHFYVLAGIPFYVKNDNFSAPYGTPLYRFYNKSADKHWYRLTSTPPNSGFVLEGNEGYVFTTQESGTVPIYRHENSGNGDQVYSTSSTPPSGYNFAGFQFYAYP
jgi:hypothetical protein